MKRITAFWLLLAAAACGSSLGTEPMAPPEALSAASGKAEASLVIEQISGDCASGITVRVSGQNLSPKARFGYVMLKKTGQTGTAIVEVALSNGSKKSVEWTTFWPAEVINPAEGAKFTGTASAWVTHAWGGWLHQTTSSIGPAC